ncbi:MAG TPA: Ig-like domain-containing protein [Gammaproteobacteria bacterium]|nr:Ig-like domain-containing protein [Gammaproteobacteria bacterium]
MIRKTGFCLLVAALLAGCIANSSFSGAGDSGGDNGAPPPNHGITVTPAKATVAAGATQQFSADNDNVTWQVDDVVGGNANLGTISAKGLYTAPALPPGGSVTITAVSQADASKSGSASATVQYSNASFSGGYVFSWHGTTSGGPVAVIGHLKADGNGGISTAVEDVNAPDGVRLDVPVDGSYKVAADGTAQAVFNSALGSADLRFIIGADGGAQVIRVDAGESAVGEFMPQTDTAVQSLSGDYVFALDGPDERGSQATLVGKLTAKDDGTIDTGILDRNDAGTIALAVAVTGAYDFAGDNGHGSLTLTSALGTSHYTFYAVSADDIRLLRVDASEPLTGQMLVQADQTFSDSDLSGDFVFDLFGGDGINPVATAGRFSADGSGNIDDAIYDRSGGISIEPAVAFTGAYSVDDSGRGTASFITGGGRTDLVFYLQSPDHALVMEADNASIRDGEFIARTNSDFSEATLDGAYTLASADGANPAVGGISFDGDGNVDDGVEIRSGASQAVALDGHYTLDADHGGRGELALATEGGGQESYVMYVIGPARVVLLGQGPGALPFGWLRQQHAAQ